MLEEPFSMYSVWFQLLQYKLDTARVSSDILFSAAYVGSQVLN